MMMMVMVDMIDLMVRDTEAIIQTRILGAGILRTIMKVVRVSKDVLRTRKFEIDIFCTDSNSMDASDQSLLDTDILVDFLAVG